MFIHTLSIISPHSFSWMHIFVSIQTLVVIMWIMLYRRFHHQYTNKMQCLILKKGFLLEKNQQKMRRAKVSSPFLVYTKAIVTPKKIAWYLVRYQKWSFMLSFLKAHFNYGKSRTWFWQTCQVEMLVHETYKVRLYR